RLSPSVSMVTINAVSDMPCLVRHDHFGPRDADAHDLLERVEVGGQNFVLTVFPGHEGAAAITCGLPGGCIMQQVPDRSEQLSSGLSGDAETLPLDHAVRIDQGDHGHA